MCVVSMVMDHYNERWPKEYPWIQQPTVTYCYSDVTRAEFEALKKEVENLKELLVKATEYDRRNNEPNCEIEEKVAAVKKIAELVGVSLDDILKGVPLHKDSVK